MYCDIHNLFFLNNCIKYKKMTYNYFVVYRKYLTISIKI